MPRSLRPPRTVVLALFAAYVCVGAWLVLRPVPDAPQAGVHLAVRAFHAIGLHGMTATAAEILCNIALFVPLPVLGLWVLPRRPLWWWPALGFLSSGAVELVQAVALPHRSGSWVDLVANTSGALIGSALAEALHLTGHRTGPWAPATMEAHGVPDAANENG